MDHILHVQTRLFHIISLTSLPQIRRTMVLEERNKNLVRIIPQEFLYITAIKNLRPSKTKLKQLFGLLISKPVVTSLWL